MVKVVNIRDKASVLELKDFILVIHLIELGWVHSCINLCLFSRLRLWSHLYVIILLLLAIIIILVDILIIFHHHVCRIIYLFDINHLFVVYLLFQLAEKLIWLLLIGNKCILLWKVSLGFLGLFNLRIGLRVDGIVGDLRFKLWLLRLYRLKLFLFFRFLICDLPVLQQISDPAELSSGLCPTIGLSTEVAGLLSTLRLILYCALASLLFKRILLTDTRRFGVRCPFLFFFVKIIYF